MPPTWPYHTLEFSSFSSLALSLSSPQPTFDSYRMLEYLNTLQVLRPLATGVRKRKVPMRRDVVGSGNEWEEQKERVRHAQHYHHVSELLCMSLFPHHRINTSSNVFSSISGSLTVGIGCTDTTVREGLYAAGYNLSRPHITALPPRPPLPKPLFTAGRRPPAERACILVTRRASVARCATKSAPDLPPHPSSVHRGAAPLAGPTSTQAALHVPDRTRNYFQRASGAADCCGVFGASPNRPGSEPGHVSSTKAHA